jgi:hypothetical protein
MLTGEELINWIALSRVHTGAVVRYHGGLPRRRSPIPHYLLPGLHIDALARVGLVSLGQPDHLGRETLSLTEAGQARYGALCISKLVV